MVTILPATQVAMILFCLNLPPTMSATDTLSWCKVWELSGGRALTTRATSPMMERITRMEMKIPVQSLLEGEAATNSWIVREIKKRKAN